MKFCDLRCRFARFPEEAAVDGAGSCRTFAALYCGKKRTYVHKNMPCAEKTLRKPKRTVRPQDSGGRGRS